MRDVLYLKFQQKPLRNAVAGSLSMEGLKKMYYSLSMEDPKEIFIQKPKYGSFRLFVELKGLEGEHIKEGLNTV